MAKIISYNKLWKLLIDKNMNKSDLRDVSKISTASLAKLGRNENLTTAVLLKICNALDCDISDIMEVTDIEDEEFSDVSASNSEKHEA
jgi:DNA-binding Xre family transcriptional regulator